VDDKEEQHSKQWKRQLLLLTVRESAIEELTVKRSWLNSRMPAMNIMLCLGIGG
jgi:hypothetical protein